MNPVTWFRALPPPLRKALVFYSAFISIPIILVVLLSIRLPVSEDEAGDRVRIGWISECKISPARVDLALQITMADGFKLSGRASKKDRELYEYMCSRRARINVRYHLERYKWRGDIYVFDRIYEV